MKFCDVCKQVMVYFEHDTCVKCLVDMALAVELLLADVFTDE